jgi:hypothetical protein
VMCIYWSPPYLVRSMPGGTGAGSRGLPCTAHAARMRPVRLQLTRARRMAWHAGHYQTLKYRQIFGMDKIVYFDQSTKQTYRRCAPSGDRAQQPPPPTAPASSAARIAGPPPACRLLPANQQPNPGCRVQGQPDLQALVPHHHQPAEWRRLDPGGHCRREAKRHLPQDASACAQTPRSACPAAPYPAAGLRQRLANCVPCTHAALVMRLRPVRHLPLPHSTQLAPPCRLLRAARRALTSTCTTATACTARR